MLAGLTALLLAGCGDNDKAADTDSPAPETQATGDAGTRAQDALGEAGDAARQTMESLGEAGAAGVEALKENAPEIKEGLNNAGERLKNAAGALVEDANQPDAPGDSKADANETPEALEPAR
jgi:hypothetical protein